MSFLSVIKFDSSLVLYWSAFDSGHKFYRIDYEYKKIAKVFALIFISGIAYYYLISNELLSIGIKIIISVGFVSALFILKVVEKEEFIKVLSLFKK